MDYNVDLFSSLAADDNNERVAHRKSLAVANKRVSDRFGAFLAASKNREEYSARLDLIRADVQEAVASVCNEHGGDPIRIERSILSHLVETSMVKEAPGKEHMKGVSPKRNRQYEHIKEQLIESGKSEEDAKEEAARTVNKQRAEKGETKDSKVAVFPDPQDAGEAFGNDADDPFPSLNEKICPDCGDHLLGDEYYCSQCGRDLGAKNPEDYPQDQPSPGYELGGEAGPYLASTKESRRPKMCPYHREVTDISLASGNPEAGFNAMSQHAWGEQHCQGAYEGGCNFKPAMVTQKFWDDKAEQAAERREQRELERAQQQEISEPVAEDIVPDSPEGLDDAPSLDEGSLDFEMSEAPSAIGEGISESVSDMGSLEPMAASTKEALTAQDFVLIAQAIATSPIEDKSAVAQHFASYLANTNPRFDAERFIAAAEGNPQTGRDNYRGPEPIEAAYNKEGEALKTVDVTEGGETPSPKIDKGKWDPNDRGKSGEPIDTESEGSPNPTERIDPLDRIIPDNESDFLEGTKAVTEHQDADKSTSPQTDKANSGSWKGNNGASPVTSSEQVSLTSKTVAASLAPESIVQALQQEGKLSNQEIHDLLVRVGLDTERADRALRTVNSEGVDLRTTVNPNRTVDPTKYGKTAAVKTVTLGANGNYPVYHNDPHAIVEQLSDIHPEGPPIINGIPGNELHAYHPDLGGQEGGNIPVTIEHPDPRMVEAIGHVIENSHAPDRDTVKQIISQPRTSSIDPDRNPIIDMLQSGFVPKGQIDTAIEDWKKNDSGA